MLRLIHRRALDVEIYMKQTLGKQQFKTRFKASLSRPELPAFLAPHEFKTVTETYFFICYIFVDTLINEKLEVKNFDNRLASIGDDFKLRVVYWSFCLPTILEQQKWGEEQITKLEKSLVNQADANIH